MTVRTKVVLANPEFIDVTLQITMTVQEWRKVNEALGNDQHYEASRVKYAIIDVINKALNSFTETIDEAKERI